MANQFQFLYGPQSAPMSQPRVAPQAPAQAPVRPPVRRPMNPAQMMSAVIQHMNNPFGFLKQQFPDIPDELANNPGGIMQYLQQTRNISDADVQSTANQIPWPQGRS